MAQPSIAQPPIAALLASESTESAESESIGRRERLLRQMSAVRRRSRRIHLLRVLIPGAIVLLAVLNFGWIVIASIINSMNSYSTAATEIRMTNPHYFGQSEKGDHYLVSGFEAYRKDTGAAGSSIFYLKSPKLDYHSVSGGVSQATADSGLYNRDTQLLTLTGHVFVAPANSDLTFRTEEATVDLTKSQIYGDKHIVGDGPTRHMEGETYVIADNGRTVIMTGRGDTQFHYVNKQP